METLQVLHHPFGQHPAFGAIVHNHFLECCDYSRIRFSTPAISLPSSSHYAHSGPPTKNPGHDFQFDNFHAYTDDIDEKDDNDDDVSIMTTSPSPS